MKSLCQLQSPDGPDHLPGGQIDHTDTFARTDIVDDTHKAIEARGKDFRATHTFDPSNKVAVEIPEQPDTFIVPLKVSDVDDEQVGPARLVRCKEG
jgi:hypothetical protein